MGKRDGDGEEKGDKKRCINIVCNVKIVKTYFLD